MSKKNLILGGVLLFLIAAAYIYQGPWQEWRLAAGKPDNFLAGIEIEGADRIRLVKNGENTELEKVGERWLVAGTKDFYVRPEQISQLESSFAEAKKLDLELVSDNPEKKEDFATGENGRLVTFLQGERVLGEFVVGTTGSDYQSTYVSRPDSDSTYLAKAGLKAAFDHDDWLDRVIFSTPREKISRIRFQYPNREFQVEKSAADEEEAVWQGTAPYKFEIDEEKLEPVLGKMADLRAVEIPVQDFQGTGLERNLMIIQATGDDGLDQTLMIGNPRDDGDEDPENDLYYAKRGDSDNLYLISKRQRDELDLEIRDLR